MNNAFNRFQSAFGFFTTVIFTVAAFVAVSDFLISREPTASITPGALNVIKGRAHYHSRTTTDLASIRFSLDADLSPLFTWNTKSVFVYVTVEWDDPIGSPKHDANKLGAAKGAPPGHTSAIIWDSIITAPSSDFLARVGPATMKKLKKSAQGKTIDPSRGLIKLNNQRPKYQLTAPVPLASLKNVHLQVHYNVQPWVGLLTWDIASPIFKWGPLQGSSSIPFDLPAIKPKKSEIKAEKTAKVRN